MPSQLYSPLDSFRLVAITAKTVVERDSLFRGLPKTTLARIAALGSRRVYEEGAIVFMRGDPGESLCGVVSGRVRISSSLPTGKEVFLNIMEPGDSFGEIALLDGQPRTATATAMARTELIIFNREPFLALLSTEPQLATHLIGLLCRRVRWTAQLMEDSALLSVPARMAKRLLSLAHLNGSRTPAGTKLALSQEELAQFLGVSRQIVNQYLQVWKAHGWLVSGRGHLTICSASSLEALVRAQ
jgi:CRP/FNR family transcriptional regulator, cyclic AMP receptor protein